MRPFRPCPGIPRTGFNPPFPRGLYPFVPCRERARWAEVDLHSRQAIDKCQHDLRVALDTNASISV